MKAQHRRRAAYRPRLELAIGLLGLVICGLGIGRITADVIENHRAAVVPQEPITTTTTMINSSVIEPETTTPVEPTTTTVPRPAGRVPAPVLRKAAATAVPSSTTTTTGAPKTPLEVALKYLGQTGPWADDDFNCAKFLSYVAQEAKVPDFISRDGPSALYADAEAAGRLTQDPGAGGMIFIDLQGPEGHNQPLHVGIVEYVEGTTVGIVQANGKPDPSVITRTTYELGGGYIVGFAPFMA